MHEFPNFTKCCAFVSLKSNAREIESGVCIDDKDNHDLK